MPIMFTFNLSTSQCQLFSVESENTSKWKYIRNILEDCLPFSWIRNQRSSQKFYVNKYTFSVYIIIYVSKTSISFILANGSLLSLSLSFLLCLTLPHLSSNASLFVCSCVVLNSPVCALRAIFYQRAKY